MGKEEGSGWEARVYLWRIHFDIWQNQYNIVKFKKKKKKETTCNGGDLGSMTRSGRSPGGGHGNPLQYSCLGNLMDRGAWRATVYRVAKSWT